MCAPPPRHSTVRHATCAPPMRHTVGTVAGIQTGGAIRETNTRSHCAPHSNLSCRRCRAGWYRAACHVSCIMPRRMVSRAICGVDTILRAICGVDGISEGSQRYPSSIREPTLAPRAQHAAPWGPMVRACPQACMHARSPWTDCAAALASHCAASLEVRRRELARNGLALPPCYLPSRHREAEAPPLPFQQGRFQETL